MAINVMKKERNCVKILVIMTIILCNDGKDGINIVVATKKKANQ